MVRSILPQNVNFMALTATATKTLRKDVSVLLGMESPVLVSVSLKDQVFSCWSFNNGKSFRPIADQLYEHQAGIGRTIIFCRKLDDVSYTDFSEKN